MLRRVTSLLLSLLLIVLLGSPMLAQRPLAASKLYFTSVNDNICPLNDATMPFWSGGSLYVPSTVFSSYDLDISYLRDTAEQSAYLYNRQKVIGFDLANGGSNNKQGTYYSASGLLRGGMVYFPLAFVCDYFGLRYSITDTKWAPMVRICSDSVILSDKQIIDAGASMLSERYYDYMEKKSPPAAKPSVPANPERPPVRPGQPPEEEEDPMREEEETKNSGRLLIALRAGSAGEVSAALDVLDHYGFRAAVFFPPEKLADYEDQLRRLVASGGRIGFDCDAGTTAADLEEANALLQHATGTVSRLTLSSGSGALSRHGYLRYTPSVRSGSGSGTASQKTEVLLKKIGDGKVSGGILLEGSTAPSTLGQLCPRLKNDGWIVSAVNETVCR